MSNTQVLLYNKNTGKYLRKHSGSFNRFCNNQGYNKAYVEALQKANLPVGYWKWTKEESEKARYILFGFIFDATPEEARVYASEGAVKASLYSVTRKGKLPDYLEVHEIKQTSVCVMRPDGSSNCDPE